MDGKWVENQAWHWWVQRAPESRLLVRNYRCRVGEIDLILEQGSDLVFVEVRGRRRGQSWQSGIESVGPRKQRRLRLTAERFLQSYRGSARCLRFDILDWDGERWTHLQNALII